MIQLSGYKLKGYFLWLKDTKAKYVSRMFLLSVLSFFCVCVTSALFDDKVLLLNIRSKCGKSYKFKVFSKGGVIMDDYEGNDYSESESDNEDSVEATADNNDANAELIETNDTNEAKKGGCL